MSTVVDSWPRASDQIQMYPDRYTIAQYAVFVCLFLLYDCLRESLNTCMYITKHLMYGPLGNWLVLFSLELSLETSPSGPYIKVYNDSKCSLRLQRIIVKYQYY